MCNGAQRRSPPFTGYESERIVGMGQFPRSEQRKERRNSPSRPLCSQTGMEII